MSAEHPARPADLPTAATFTALAQAYGVHAGALVDARLDRGPELTAAVSRSHALAALATAHALAERVLHSRWVNMRDALGYGATVEQVAAAMGLDVDEVTFGLGMWADGQLREGLMCAVEHAEVLALVRGGGGR